MQYIQGGGRVPGNSGDYISYQGERGGQIGIMCAIQIMDSILVSATLVLNICDNISTLKLVLVQLESVT